MACPTIIGSVGSCVDGPIIADWLTGIGTLLLGIVAIWGDVWRSMLMPPKLTLELVSETGLLTRYSSIPGGPPGQQVIYFHLKVVNQKPRLPVSNCQVLITRVTTKRVDGSFQEEPMRVPLQLVWAPNISSERYVTVTKEKVADFLCVAENQTEIMPILYGYTNTFVEVGTISANKTIRYYLEIHGSNYASKTPYFIDVTWDGAWDCDVTKMHKHLTISPPKLGD
jgi:hypothetical protein